jgi:signal transduction histidine kinase
MEQTMNTATLTCSTAVVQLPALDPDGLATLSHELKTPLVAMLGFVQLLESDAMQPLSEPQRRRAEQIERAGQQVLELVTTLLGQAKRGEWAAAVGCRA